MSKPQIDGTGLLVAALAAALALTVLTGPFVWLASITGFVLVLILLGYDRDGYRTVAESLAFAAVFALCATVASAVFWRFVAENQGRSSAFDGRLSNQWLPLFWLGILIVFWPIDRARMSGRTPAALPSLSSSFSFTPAPPPPLPAIPLTVPAPVPPVAYPPPPQPAAPQPAFTRPTFSPSLPDPEPVLPPPPPEPPASTPLRVAAPPIAPPPAPPLIAIPAGREAMIYVNLVGEGLNVLRAVRAENLGRDYYKIAEEMPPGETWQFGPGQVVRCKKRNLSSGKAMVAIEEAPRAN